MPKNKKAQITGKWLDSTIKECLEASHEAMSELVNKPKNEPEKFFPHGIELISLTLEAKEIFKFDFKIAGEKGLKTLIEKNQEFQTEKNDSITLEK